MFEFILSIIYTHMVQLVVGILRIYITKHAQFYYFFLVVWELGPSSCEYSMPYI